MFRRNPRAIAELRLDPKYRLLRRAAARAAAEAARQVAPVGATGAYQRSIRVGEEGDVVAVTSSDAFAHLVEFGSVNNPAYAPLRRGARAAGLDLRGD
jgi:hypothetical protein